MKDRYYSETRALLRARAQSPADVANHPVIKEPYDISRDRECKRALSMVLSQSRHQEKKDAEVLAEAQRITDMRLAARRAEELDASANENIGLDKPDGGVPGGRSVSPSSNSQLPPTVVAPSTLTMADYASTIASLRMMDESNIIPVVGAERRELQGLLQAAVQSVEWTYSLFWQLCPQQRFLVWENGYYNGAIKTRKTTQPAEVTAEEAALERSQQLRELYETLLAGESSSEARACTALSPEDLTETEWFYLMCVSFSFSPPSGIPGKAYARRKHVWLSGANEVDSKIFSRAILAKSANIQTVVCIPMLDGVVELGTTDKVKEDAEFVEHIKSFFQDHPKSKQKPALSDHSTYEEHEEEDEEDEEEEEDDEDEEIELEEEMTMSEEIRIGSPDDDDISTHNHILESTHTLDAHMDMMNLVEEGGNYSKTVWTLLMAQPTGLLSESISTSSYLQSSFTTWNAESFKEQQRQQVSQWMLKHVILRVPFLHDHSVTGNRRKLPREELNHVVAERRRREKLNERFITLRSMVPFVTKMDKVSILGDTIEYVNHLRKRINELEMEMETHHKQQQHKRMRSACKGKIMTSSEEVEVSIIESDVLLEMRCDYRDGLLLDILKVLKDLGIEATAVYTTVNDRDFEAEIRAKVKGKKATIAEVKRFIHHIISNTKL